MVVYNQDFLTVLIKEKNLYFKPNTDFNNRLFNE